MASSQESASPIYFAAKGLSDALDATDEFHGAMASLSNLVFDPSATDVMQCRAASVPLLLAKYPNPILSFGFVSVFIVVGDILYGMVASKLHPGKDQPFAFNLATNASITVPGSTAANTPTSPATSGAWVPPQMDVIGTKVVLTHPGFATGPFATATDTITFAANPANGDTLTFGAQATNQAAGVLGSLITFVTGTPAAYQVQIGANLAATLANLLAFLQSSGDANLGACTYAVVGSVLTVSYIAPGADGNTYPITSSALNAAVASPTLTGGAGYHFGWFDISTPSAPVYGAGNMAINPLPAVPSAVSQFNSRAYFLVNPLNGQPGLIPSDPLNALSNSNGSYVLTFGDNLPLTALAGLPLTNQLGGVIQSLIVFKGGTNIYQVTGDPLPNTAAGAWAKNTLNVATGTLAPRSIVSTPVGLNFLSPQGYRVIDFDARVSQPTGADGKGVTVPFIQCPVPSRVAAACNAKILRVSLTTAQGAQWEFWLDIARQVWTGPHTFPANMIAPYKNTFIISPIALPNAIYQSDWLQNSGSTFVEAGTQLTWDWQTSLLPDMKDMQQHELHETIIKFSSATGASASMIDEAGNVVSDANGNGAATATLPASTVTVNWGSATYQASILYGQTFAMSPVQINWPAPITFGRASLQLTGTSDSVTRIGALSMRIEQLGYLPQPGN